MKPKPPRARLVYSSDSGRVSDAARPAANQANPVGDEIVRVKREIAGRRGRPVTTIRGVPLTGAELSKLAGELKRMCGAGGSAKEGVIEIQGDHRDRVVAWLIDRGYRVKRPAADSSDPGLAQYR